MLTGQSSTFTCISIAPIANRVVGDLDGDNGTHPASVFLITIWELGEAAGPLLIGPLSEMYGRLPLITITNMLFILGTVLAALSQNTTQLITARALTGMSVSSNVLNPPIVGDMFAPERRGKAMSMFMFATLAGGTLGPAFSGAVAQRLGWRTVLWTSTLLAGLCQTAFWMFFQETYKVTILRKRLAGHTKDAKNAPADDASIGKGAYLDNGSDSLWTSIRRPAMVLFGSGILMALSLFGSVVFTYFYIVSVTLPGILQHVYGLSEAMTGYAFLANGKSVSATHPPTAC